jgi:threonine dehydratase
VTIDDVRRAAAAIEGAVLRTPSAHSETLSALLACTVVLKFENLQFTASFKERGALNRLLHLTPAERASGVVAVSAGNHAQAVARHAGRLGIDATIVMPTTTPFVKVRGTRLLGAHVVLHGETVAEALVLGHQLQADEGRTFVHPFDDPAVIAGQGTVALELLADHPDLDMIVCPVGGGGLLAGTAAVTAALRPEVQLVGVEVEAYPSLAQFLAGEPDRPVPGGATMAEGIAVNHVGRVPMAVLEGSGASLQAVTVSEASVEAAVSQLVEIEKVVAEGAGAAGLAAVNQHRPRFEGKRVGVLVTGGNIDPRQLASVILRGLVYDGRLVLWRVWVDDRPGALSLLTQVVGDAGGNIVDVAHQRLFLTGPIRSTEVELAVETLDADHAATVRLALRQAGYVVQDVPLDHRPP